ncbi:hypothetical protein ACFWP5_52220 [Streptomyces sp. NPDC058469]|uniref:hypothetical protein n=1 Tax=Streptomyces sp. NPDC058469 TaxID=3346514 RepID=UPI0036515211
MPSVLGLSEAREKRVREESVWLREEAERVQAALGEAEAARQWMVDPRATVAEVLAEPPSAVVDSAQSAARASPTGDLYLRVRIQPHRESSERKTPEPFPRDSSSPMVREAICRVRHASRAGGAVV